MQKLLSYFFDDFHSQSRTVLFKKALYIFLLIKALYWLSDYSLFFGDHSIVYYAPQQIGWFRDLAFLVYNHSPGPLAAWFIAALMTLSLGILLFRRTFFIGDVLLWFITVNLHNALYPTLTGGDFLLNQLLFFNCFLSFRYTVSPKTFDQLRIFLHNISISAVMIQVCLVYLLSSITKLGDASWLSGNAIAQIAQVKHFSASFSVFPGNKVFAVLDYIVLFYQLLFPILVWIPLIKKPLLTLGIIMHLYIGLVMGLPAFAAMMLIAYIYFWPKARAS